MPRAYHRWTDADTQKVRELFGTMPTTELAQLMGRSPSFFYKKLASLGISADRDELPTKLLPLVKAAGAAGIGTDQLAKATGSTPTSVARALRAMTDAGQLYRHRLGNAYQHYLREEDCKAGLKRRQAARRESRRAADRRRHHANGKPAADQRPTKATKRAKPATDRRPGVEQLVTLPGTPAPVRVAGPRGPAHIPGEPHIPPTARVTRLAPLSDSRYSPKPGEFSDDAPRFSKRRPGTYSPELPPSAWASAVARHAA